MTDPFNQKTSSQRILRAVLLICAGLAGALIAFALRDGL